MNTFIKEYLVKKLYKCMHVDLIQKNVYICMYVHITDLLLYLKNDKRYK